ncbi:MAG: amidase family protein [Streptosporangiales bacterium]|nr:amidase family protein [Streptosporangiales bacterium]
MNEWAGQTAVGIASAVRSGKATAAEVVAAHLAQIRAHDPEIGAFVRVREQRAAREAEAVDARADRPDLPLAGVPVSVKDTVPVAGEPLRHGSAATPAGPQASDDPLVARLRAAGAVVTGLTNLPELAIYSFTDSAYGITRNPWNRSRTAGGSSGGAAASVASGMVPLAHGSDGLGSLRIPAAACGLFSIKPGPGVVPGTGHWFGLSENGPIAATVADAALMLGVMAGTAYPLAGPGPLRIALSARPPGRGLAIAPDRVAAVRESGKLLAGLGHSVSHADPPYPGWLAPVLSSYWFAAPASEAGPHLADMEARTRRHVRAGQAVLRVRPPRPSDRERLRAALAPFFDSHDVLLVPTLARPCPPALRYGTRSWRRSVATALRFSPLTGVWNLAGYPAATVPVPASGMPGSVQLVAAEGREDLLLNLAAQLERARPWPRHAPRYVTGGD